MKIKKMTINISKILKIIMLICLSMVLCLIAQYYLNLKSDNLKMAEDLKIAVFVNGEFDKDTAISEINKFFNFNVADYADAERSYDVAAELNPELENIVPDDTVSYPCYVLLNNVSAVNMQQLEEINKEILSLPFVIDTAYDAKGFSLFYRNINILSEYEKIFYAISFFIGIIFLIKVMLFILKKKFKELIFEILYGFFSSLCGYVIICVLSAANHNNIFFLDWHILPFIVSLGAVISFMMKESNDKK